MLVLDETEEFELEAKDGSIVCIETADKTTVKHVDLRPLDEQELMMEPFYNIREGLRVTVARSEEAYCISINDQPEGYCGVEGAGQVWYLSSQKIFDICPELFLSVARAFLAQWLDYYGFLYNWVLFENRKSQKWLAKHEGFTLEYWNKRWVYFWKELQ